MSENMSTEITMIGIDPSIFPRGPGANSRGENAAIVVSTAKTTGTLIRLTPRTAASRPGTPRSRSE